MSYKDFIERAVITLNERLFHELKDSLVDKYLSFFFIDEESIGIETLAEKLCDYFEKIELKAGKSFEQVVEKYANDLDAIVRERIVREPKAKKNEPIPIMPRARKYYEKACLIKKNNKLTEYGLIDYSRLMLCLYMAIINNDFKEIDDFDYAASCLSISKLTEALQMEKGFLGKKTRFDIKEPYSSDRSTFVMLIIMFYYIKSKEIIGEY